MSGGVDSSAAAILLLKQGYEVAGATMKLGFPETDAAVPEAKEICEKIGIKHFEFDFAGEFSENVIKPFIEEYRAGHTPNPCVFCNKYLKFGAFLKRALELGYEKIATGHYAAIEKDGGYLKIRRTEEKDQSYVLYNLNQEILEKLILPVSGMSKTQVRKICAGEGLSVAEKKDSQDICFLKNRSYSDFVGETAPGDFVDKSGSILGRHGGISKYTIGQRKGLFISAPNPLYVTDIIAAENKVVLGEEADLYTKKFEITNFNFCYPLKSDIIFKVAVRYNAKPEEATVKICDTKCEIEFSQPQRAVTLGQSAVIYENGFLQGGGIISRRNL